MTIPTDQPEMSWQHLSLFSSLLSFGTNRLPPEELLCSTTLVLQPCRSVCSCAERDRFAGTLETYFPSDGLVPL